MRRVEVVTLDEEIVCGYCCNPFGPNALALRWNSVEFCTHHCLECYAETEPGRDYIAAQDQALAQAHQILDRKPSNFVLLYGDDAEPLSEVGSVLLAQQQFVFACLPVVAQLASHDADIAPPG